MPGLAAALALAGAWRLTGGSAFLALALATLILPALVGVAASFAASFAADDALLAAAELDRRAGLDGLLATGFEISRGRIRTFLAPEALRRARDAAHSLDGSEIPMAPPGWVRYLSLPAALVLAMLALPGGGAPRGTGFGGERLIAAGGPKTVEAGRAGAEHRADEARETADSGRPSSSGGGPVDLEEAAVFRERFPEYEDLVRRYFAGR